MEFKPYLIKDKIKDKVLNFTLNESEDKEFGKSMNNPVETRYHLDLGKKNWFVFDDCFGTSEEKLLVKYIDKVYEKLSEKFDEIYLVRNERHFKIYNFDDGRALEPDFVLFLSNSKEEPSIYYQVFIEPKGQHLLAQDKWKEDFLKKLKDENRIEQLWKNREYTIWGMPFYNEVQRISEFSLEVEILLNDI
jgi:type III restriction enzyme